MSRREEIDRFDHRGGGSEMNQRLRRAALWAVLRRHQRAHRLWRRELLRVKGWRRAKALNFGLWSLNSVRLPTMSHPGQEVQVQRTKHKVPPLGLHRREKLCVALCLFQSLQHDFHLFGW